MSSLTPDLNSLSPQKRALYEKLLKEKRQAAAPATQLTRRQTTGPVPLSFAQQRLLFLYDLNPTSAVYNVPIALRLSGPLLVKALEQTLHEIVRRHEALRTTFATVEGQTVQVVAPSVRVPLPVVDLRNVPAADQKAKIRQRLDKEICLPFDLARGPVFRATLLWLEEQEYVLLLMMHHIVCDGWSLGLLDREIGTLYEAYAAGKASPLPELSIQYADYSLWQRNWLQGEVLETQLTYWKQQLQGSAATLDLSMGRPQPPVPSFRGAKYPHTLPANLSAALQELCQREGVTLFMALLTAFKVLLLRYTGQEDILVGSPIANRKWSELENLIGFLANTLVLRSDLKGNPTFRDLLGRVKETARRLLREERQIKHGRAAFHGERLQS